ncbi:MAG: hypothetical protein HZB36_02525 [Candidatus Omnitrophica bacterium]|nr:hypothetical protein [Candidatus Omnitrophota bacterium]
MGIKNKLKREDFIKDFLGLTERVLLRELPKVATNEDFVRESYNIVYIRLRHINMGCLGAVQEILPEGGCHGR